MLNIVVPMAGAGSRFAKAGYEHPKPLIEVVDRPMIKVVIDNLTPSCEHRFIFICQRAHVAKYGLREKLGEYAPGCEIVEIDGLTEGAACTVLKARDLIDSADPIMIANSDQFVDIDINDYLETVGCNDLDGLIMTMTADDPKWSFAAVDGVGRVTRVVEKEVISNEATVGIYNFSQGSVFVEAADKMIEAGKKVNGEYYVAPVYNELIEQNGHIGIYNIGAENDGMYGLGIPQDLNLFLNNPKLKEWL